MALNDISMHPTGVQAEYPGVANPTESSTDQPTDVYAINATLSGHNPPGTGSIPTASDLGSEAKRDVIEGEPGLIESTELAPLGEQKVAADPSLLTKATGMAKGAIRSLGGNV